MERSVSSPDGIEAGKGITACLFGKNRRSPMKINIMRSALVALLPLALSATHTLRA